MFSSKLYQEHVYEPNEDTFILLDALENEFFKKPNNSVNLVCEIGTGNGVPGVFMNKLFGKAFVMMTDINPVAIQCSTETISRNKCAANTGLIQQSLFQGFRENLKFDVIIFNPPYVVTENASVNQAQTEKSIYAALDGGLFGLKIVEIFLSELKNHLHKNGKCYMVAIEQNDINGKLSELILKNGFKFEIVLNRRAGIENLSVLKIQLNQGVL